MAEFLTSGEVFILTETSKRMERYWQSRMHPEDFSNDEHEELDKFYSETFNSLATAAAQGPRVIGLFNRVFMGIYHRPEIDVPSYTPIRLMYNMSPQ